jgi:hypothetical protein
MVTPDDDRPGNSSPLPDDLVVPDDLSGLLDGAIGTTDMPSQIGEHGVVSVIAAIDPMPAAPYITEVQPTDDIAISLPYDKAVAYGMTVLAAAHRAHYLAAVLAQITDVMGGRRGRPSVGDASETDETVRLVVKNLMDDLPDLDDQATAPLRFAPFIRRSDGRPMVRVSVPPHTEAITGWTFAETLDHAHAVLAQAVVSQLDTAYRTVISVTFESGEQRGRAAVHDLGNYFWDKPNPGGYGDPTDLPAAGRRPDPRKARPTGKGKGRRR